MSVLMTHAAALITLEPRLGFTDFHHGLQFYGQPGVEFFFVLSGFVMGLVHGGDVGRIGRVPAFAWSRFCRIYPLLWVVLAAQLWRYWGRLPFGPRDVLHWFTLVGPVPFELVPVVWTLKIELVFYALFALVMLPRVGMPVLLGWVVVSALFIAGEPVLTRLPRLLDNEFVWKVLIYSPEFFAGLIAGVWFRRGRIAPGVALGLVVGALAVLLWRLWQDEWGAVLGALVNRVTYGVAYAALGLGLANLERAGWLRPGRWALVMGALSYPLYLSHVPVIFPLAGWLGGLGRPGWMGGDVVFLLLMAGAIAVSAVLAYGVDRPVGRWLRAVGQRMFAPDERAGRLG